MKANPVGTAIKTGSGVRVFLLTALLLPWSLVATGVMAGSQQPAADDERPVVRLSPGIREIPRTSGYSDIARAELNNFLVDNRLVDIAEYERAPHIVSNVDDGLVIGAGDEVFVRGQWQSPARSWGVYRRGNTYRDPISGELLGQEVRRLGTAEIVAVENDDVRRMRIRDSREELQAGDRLMLQTGAALDLYFSPASPSVPVRGTIVSTVTDSSFAAQYDTVLINLGERNGLREGHLLTVYSAPRVRQDPVSGVSLATPEQEAATLMVYRVFDRASYGIIMNSTRPSSAGDAVASQ